MRCHNLLRFLLALLAPLVLVTCPLAVYAENTGIVSVSGDKFMLNGVPFYYAGTNNYYQMVYAADVGLRPYVEEVQTETAGLGLTVLRTWAFNDGADEWNALQTSPGVYDEDIFVGLDYVLHLADQNGLRLILPFVNNWDDYGGMNQYVEWSGTASDHDDFYTDANCRTWYKNHVSTVLNRVNTFNSRIYREDPTIFAWELANEPECPSDTDGSTLEAWITEMSAYIKGIDPTHLVTTGSQGYYGPAGPPHNPRSWMSSKGCDFIPHHAVETIDFACVHAWPDGWGLDYTESMSWVSDHIDDSTELLGKPVILEEFGKQRPVETRDTFYQGWYDEVYSAAQAGDAAGGSNFWILYHDDYEDYDGFGVYYPEDTTTCAIIAAEAAMMNSLIVPNTSSTHTIQIASVSPGAERVVSIGSWYEFSDSAGWTFRPETDTDHVEFALYDSATTLAAGTTPFEQHQTRTSALWPDGPENESGELGYEVSPNVLGDNNQHLYGKPYYKSIRLYAGHLSPDSVYEVSFADSAPSRIWLHPLRSHYFTMSADILQSSELTNPVYGPASVSRTILSADLTRFEYSGLSPDNATGLKDDYQVGDYDQRPGSHGSGDFGWFPGYSLSFHNEGPGSVAVALFVTTGFTGPSGAPSNTLANDTFWKSDEVFISMGETATAKLDFDSVQGYSLSDNPFPHTAGDQSVPDGTAGVAVNIFDRLQVSAIGWEVRSGGGGRADASLIIAPRATTVVSDTTAPTVMGVEIVNLTLGHTDEYAKDSDDLELTATVTDDISTLTASDITADFSTLLVGGGSVVVAEDYTGTTATWTAALDGVSLQGDELKTVTVTATDGAGNTGTGADQITVDNTPPTAVTGFAAAPGHNKTDLSWDDPAGVDANLYQVMILSNAWGDYPNYTGDAPVYPPDALDSTPIWEGTGTSYTMTYNSDNSERDIYYYGAFAVDMALNYGPADTGAQDRSTNYWLGDVANAANNWIPDGSVFVADITKVSGTYGSAPSNPDYETCDVGPTDDGSRFGIPLPDDIVEYEDLMIFAMNYGAVSPRVVPFLPLPETTQELALSVEERSTAASGEVELSLVLSGNADEVKGLSAILTYDTAELGFVSARLSPEMSSLLGDVFFWHGCEDGTVQLDLAVLGTDVTVGGSGEVAVLTFAVHSDEYVVEVESADLRGADNQPLEADLECFESSPELPVMFRLVQSVPNPFNPVTKIAYHVPHESEVTMRVYDVAGRVVTTLVDGVVKPGRHQAIWNGLNDQGEAVSSGVYFCTMEAPDFHDSRKMTLLK